MGTVYSMRRFCYWSYNFEFQSLIESSQSIISTLHLVFFYLAPINKISKLFKELHNKFNLYFSIQHINKNYVTNIKNKTNKQCFKRHSK